MFYLKLFAWNFGKSLEQKINAWIITILSYKTFVLGVLDFLHKHVKYNVYYVLYQKKWPQFSLLEKLNFSKFYANLNIW